MIKAVDKLREALAGCIMEAGHANRFDTYWITKDAADKLIDEIEVEIAERYMELPVDADGVPIRLGDIMERVGGGPSQQACCICSGGFNDAPIWCARDFRHVKPRTLEDVLEEYYDKRGWDEADNCALNADELTAKYATEIRELLGSDA